VSASVALITDFGLRDSYVAEVHRAIAARVPGVRVLDVAHDLPAFALAPAALVIERCAARLAAGDALMAVVDPGVGGPRRRLIVHRAGRWIVGPDNGLLPTEGAAVWRVDAFPTDPAVTTFDGREVFGPLAALLAAGLDPALVGTRVFDAAPWVIPPDAPFEAEGAWRYARGVVITSDRYGNAITNLRAPVGEWEVLEPARFAGPAARRYAAVAPGAALALVGSSGRVELSVREGAANLPAGTAVVLRCA
jgi:S-adenosylmethionine hydrolase